MRMTQQIVIKREAAKLDWVGKELMKVLTKHNIDVLVSRDRHGVNASIMYATTYVDTGKPVIVLLVEDILQAGLTHEEARCMLWHEIAHVIDGATEFEADSFAVDHTSYEVWKSAINKTYAFINKEPDGAYVHRMSTV